MSAVTMGESVCTSKATCRNMFPLFMALLFIRRWINTIFRTNTGEWWVRFCFYNWFVEAELAERKCTTSTHLHGECSSGFQWSWEPYTTGMLNGYLYAYFSDANSISEAYSTSINTYYFGWAQCFHSLIA